MDSNAKRKEAQRALARTLSLSDPDGNRTRVTGVKGRCPRPLDDGASAYVPAVIQRKIFRDRRSAPSAEGVGSRILRGELSKLPKLYMVTPLDRQDSDRTKLGN